MSQALGQDVLSRKKVKLGSMLGSLGFVILIGFLLLHLGAETAAAAPPLEGTPRQMHTTGDSPRDEEEGNPGDGDPLYPDLTVIRPHDVTVEMVDWKEGGPYLRFGNTILNIGTGPLELRLETDEAEEQYTVSQVVYNRQDKAVLNLKVGEFVYHAPHYHWHLEDFVRYEIWTATLDGTLDQRLLSSGKLSYCMSDTGKSQVQPASGTAPENPIYLTCGNKRQGLSEGWGDTYEYWYEGQSLDASRLAPGLYALQSVVDPDNIVQEMNENNNTSMVYFRIEGKEISVYETREELLAADLQDLPSPSRLQPMSLSDFNWPRNQTPR